jgi:hypothetical protein
MRIRNTGLGGPDKVCSANSHEYQNYHAIEDALRLKIGSSKCCPRFLIFRVPNAIRLSRLVRPLAATLEGARTRMRDVLPLKMWCEQSATNRHAFGRSGII